ncbi:Mg-chelatase subunit ChlD [Paenibacillus turicensis]|uniref:Mg-chelatase subunit ChlD n=1 Tax=Paenibacillus turicensis TaxID=160487 RepID=A0ABS4FSW4_9BACL|nr:VWA domain-containing protein [Paenibacillus turicensis]MBP1905428.1 Mg-chelatase subunit ChlD [Paenibacillus turicensis]
MRKKYSMLINGKIRAFALILISTIFSSLFLGASHTHAAQSQPPIQDAFDAVFVLDTSYSMNRADPNKTASEVIHMFIDLSEASRTRVGFVAYNHKIVASHPLTDISIASKKSALKKAVSNLNRGGYTDLGLGLKTGGNLLAKSSSGKNEGQRQPFMILLSDGETDFGPSSPKNRTAADSAKDVESTIAQAKKLGYPIYTIGLNHDGTVNPNELKRIAEKTGGAFYNTSSADDLPEIFNTIFAMEMRSVLLPVAGVTATGRLQEIEVDIPNSDMEEANIILLSDHAIQESQLFYSSENMRMFKSNSYTLIKISQPKKGSAKLKFHGTKGDLVKINLLGSYVMEASATLGDQPPIKGKPTKIEAYLSSGSGERLKDEPLYDKVNATLWVTETSTKQSTEIPMKNQGNGFITEYTFPNSGDYTWRIRLEGPSFFRETVLAQQKISNLPPLIHGDQHIKLLKEDGLTEVDLLDIINDPNGDVLTYNIHNADALSGLGVTLSTGNKLELSPNGTGSNLLTITATDTEGASTTVELQIEVKSKYTVLMWSIAGGVVFLFVGVGLYFVFRPKPAFEGKLEGYFLATASGSDVPVKSWVLTSFSKRKVTLLELFQLLDVHEPLPEAAQIVFVPGKKGVLLVKNTSRCSMVRNRTPLAQNKQEILKYNDKLYITFQDGITEIELRYKVIKTNTNIFTHSDAVNE